MQFLPSEAKILPQVGGSDFWIGVTFKPEGARKMRAATMRHIGKPMAILIDGEVVMAPNVRESIGEYAVVNGHFTKAEVEKIVTGMRIR